MNWFKRHKFWSSVIILTIMGLVLDMVGTINTYEWFYTLTLYTVIGGEIWVIKQKGRSLLNLLWLLLGPIGIIVILCLKSRTSDRLAQEEAENLELRKKRGYRNDCL